VIVLENPFKKLKIRNLKAKRLNIKIYLFGAQNINFLEFAA
jgi:hypothetical protein